MLRSFQLLDQNMNDFNTAPRFYFKWENSIEIVVEEKNYFLVHF